MHTLNLIVYGMVPYLVSYFSKHSIETSLYSIVDPNTGLEIEHDV